MIDHAPRPLNTGEAIFLVATRGWGAASYRQGTVEKITPTGIIKIRIGDWIGEFRPDGRKRGDPYGEAIDWTPYPERIRFLQRENLLQSAYSALTNIEKLRAPFTEESLRSHISCVEEAIKRGKTLISEAEAAMVAGRNERNETHGGKA
jgi:hypothetical protein